MRAQAEGLDDAQHVVGALHDADQPVAPSAEHLLRRWTRDTGGVEQPQHLSLQPTVRAAGDLDAFDHFEQRWYPVPTCDNVRCSA